VAENSHPSGIERYNTACLGKKMKKPIYPDFFGAMFVRHRLGLHHFSQRSFLNVRTYSPRHARGAVNSSLLGCADSLGCAYDDHDNLGD
jgi:hypothetical protein